VSARLERIERAAFWTLLAWVFAMPFSLPAARAGLAVATVLALVVAVGEGRLPHLPPVGWFGAAFVAIACLATLNGVNPQLGCPKLRKLVWFVGIPVAAQLVNDRDRLLRVMTAWTAGAVVLALHVAVRAPLQARAAVASGRFATFKEALIDAGSMTNGQRLVLGLLAALTLLFVSRRSRCGAPLWAAAAAVAGVTGALVLNLKRGAWFSACVVVAALLVVRYRWRGLLIVVLVAGASLAAPVVRTRLAALDDELDAGRGGRLTMWTRIAPELVRRYPFGVGFRSLTNEMMREAAPEVEPGRDHLHSNPVQVLVATGWLGLAAYLAWMVRAVIDAVRFAVRTRHGDPEEHVAAVGLLLMLAALLLNGLVEYNLADAELVLSYGVVMGGAAAGVRRSSAGARLAE
jgi:O-antigen ligase